MSKEQRRMDRFIVIPFSSTCRSGSSVDVVDARNGKKPQQGDVGEGAARKVAVNKGESLLARLLKGFKNLSQIFAVYEEEEEEEDEEQEMVIGLPTDVKHVAHIGWDGSTSTTSSVRSWNRAAPPTAASTSSSSSTPPPQTQPDPAPPLPAPLSVRQFQLAMAAQAAAGSSTSTSSALRHCPYTAS